MWIKIFLSLPTLWDSVHHIQLIFRNSNLWYTSLLYRLNHHLQHLHIPTKCSMNFCHVISKPLVIKFFRTSGSNFSDFIFCSQFFNPFFNCRMFYSNNFLDTMDFPNFYRRPPPSSSNPIIHWLKLA